MQLVIRGDTITGQFVQEAKANKGYQESLAVIGGEYRPPDAVLFALEKTPVIAGVEVRNRTTTTFYLLMKRSAGTAELFQLNLPPGQLHLMRPKGSGPVYFPADTEAHQRIAVLALCPPADPRLKGERP